MMLTMLPLHCLILLSLTHDVICRGSYSTYEAWLQSDGTSSRFVRFSEGDTTILLCRVILQDTSASFDLQFDWKPYGSDEKVTIATEEIITFFDGRNRFSNANRTVSENTTEYRITISDIDRYDSGNNFFCKVSFHPGGFFGGGSTSSSTELKLRWTPPLPQCSTNITNKVKEGDEISYHCSAADTDRRSTGSLTIWKGDTQLQLASITESDVDRGKQYNNSYITTAVSCVKDVYVCRYISTDGFMEYNYNCTFNQPNCDPTNGALPLRDHLQRGIGLSILFIYWIAFI